MRTRLRDGRGREACRCYEYPYLPPELDLFCAYCRYNFFTQEGNPPCEDPLRCPHGAEPWANLRNFARWRERLRREVA